MNELFFLIEKLISLYQIIEIQIQYKKLNYKYSITVNNQSILIAYFSCKFWSLLSRQCNENCPTSIYAFWENNKLNNQRGLYIYKDL